MKVVAPLQSLGVSGRVGETLTFSQRGGMQYCRYQRKQKDVVTAARSAQRSKFITAVDMWQYYDFGVLEFGYHLIGGRHAVISELPENKRAPDFSLFVSDVLKFYF